MIAFEVFIAGHRVCLAGVGDEGTFNVIVGCTSNAANSYCGYHLSVSGGDRRTDEFFDWSAPSIGVGSEVTVRVVETDAVDDPSERSPLESMITTERYRDVMQSMTVRMAPDERRALLRELVAELKAQDV